jgi:hypothetical protein
MVFMSMARSESGSIGAPTSKLIPFAEILPVPIAVRMSERRVENLSVAQIANRRGPLDFGQPLTLIANDQLPNGVVSFRKGQDQRSSHDLSGSFHPHPF